MSTASQRMTNSKKEAEAIAEQIDTLKGDINELTKTVSRLVKSGYADAKDAVEETAGDAKDAARQSAGDIETVVRKNPLQAALIAAGVGFAIGLMARR